MKPSITIIGLGAGGLDQLPVGLYKKLLQAEKVYIRTADHPVVQELEQEGAVFHAFDHLYEKHARFEDVYRETAETVMQKARKEGAVTFAVPGHPLVAETTVQLLLRQPEIPVQVAGGQSFLDAVFTALEIDPNDGFQLLDGTALYPPDIAVTQHVLISQVFDSASAGEVKLSLMERYPDDYPVTVVTAAGSEAESLVTVPLFELDRAVAVSNLTAVYVAPIEKESILYREFQTLREVIATLRGPDGCPWDRKQTHESLKRYAVEEVYELLEAIDEQDDDHIAEELGDVLLQVMLHAQIGEDNGYFDIQDVIEHVTEKMIRRHPHVFGDTAAADAEEVLANWEEIKKSEKQNGSRTSMLDGIPASLPALHYAVKLQKKAAKAGFDWTEDGPVWAKVEEELNEWKHDIQENRMEAAAGELGDVLFAVVNAARHHDMDPEEALRQTNRKFSSRFRHIEMRLQEQNLNVEDQNLEQLDVYWEEAKQNERREGSE
ncbi:nucleoside triphosphate pyrophosphohydrolase [Alkalicoccus luteus]|uniref:Nucleoside triphosphate pyrophosphohydrolase n=1 Tax=Alkalicoccus luteus TaxID=1237094 RepID=A0A969PTG8_9BACI|nr:nucleoside triphosphate pyrophosphohydrolase [Alkalicoccus luteus]NJP39028.1 nucleoside triphosphate pyrophosphohydrolase [Alkalicoccus luteus]